MASVGDLAMAARRPYASAAPPDRAAVALATMLVALAGVAWLVTAQRMHGMGAGPGTDLGSLGFYVSVWVAMMAAMMFPSIAPMVVMHSRIQAGQVKGDRARRSALTRLFVGGCLVAWTMFGLAAYGLFALGRSLSTDAPSWDRGGRPHR